MQAFIHITFAEISEISFHNPIISWVKEEFPEVACLDLDNHSDNLMMNYATTLLEKSDRIIVLVTTKNHKSSFGNLLGLVNKVMRTRGKAVQLLLNGSFPMLEKMGKTALKEKFIQTDDEEKNKALITDFFVATSK